MKTKFAIGDVVRVGFDRKVVYCRIIGQNGSFFNVESLTPTPTGKVLTRWIRDTWILEG